MANGKIRFGKQSGGQLALVFPDGVTNTEVIVPESGELATKQYVDDNAFNPQPIHTGTVSFNSTTNNISLTDIVTALGLEIGDVIQISGATDSKNNSEFTVEVITDDDNIIVNQAHANNGTTKNVATRASDTGVTVKLLAKYYNTSSGLGQGWVDVTGIRAFSTSYPNNTNRDIEISIGIRYGTSSTFTQLTADGVANIARYGNDNQSAGIYVPCSACISKSYSIAATGSPTIIVWFERR